MLFVVLAQRGWPEPAVVVEFGRRFAVRHGGGVEVRTGETNDYRLHLADGTVANQFTRLMEFLRRTLLAAGLHDSFVLTSRRNHRAAFGDRQRQRLFAIDVFPCRTRFNGLQRVPVVGGCDQDRVNVFRFEQLAVIAKTDRHFPSRLFDFPGRGLQVLRIHVTDRHHGSGRQLHQPFHVRRALQPGPDEPNANLLTRRHVGSKRGPIKTRRDGEDSPTRNTGPQEVAAVG